MPAVLTKLERDRQRMSLFARLVHYEALCMAQLRTLTHLLREDDIGDAPEVSAADVTRWIVDAERYSATFDRRQGSIFTDTVRFLDEAAAGMPEGY